MTRRDTILIVDDEPFNIKLLASLLENDHELLFACDGKRALEIIDTSRPDLVLLDLMMPGMDGLDICREMKLHPDWSAIPVVFLTARSDIATKLRHHALSGTPYLTKPFTVDAVIACVRKHLPTRAAA